MAAQLADLRGAGRQRQQLLGGARHHFFDGPTEPTEGEVGEIVFFGVWGCLARGACVSLSTIAFLQGRSIQCQSVLLATAESAACPQTTRVIAGLVPSVVSFTAAMSACSSGGSWAKALKLLRQLEAGGVRSLTTQSCWRDLACGTGFGCFIFQMHGKLVLFSTSNLKIGCHFFAIKGAHAGASLICGVLLASEKSPGRLQAAQQPNEMSFVAVAAGMASSGEWQQAFGGGGVGGEGAGLLSACFVQL